MQFEAGLTLVFQKIPEFSVCFSDRQANILNDRFRQSSLNPFFPIEWDTR